MSNATVLSAPSVDLSGPSKHVTREPLQAWLSNGPHSVEEKVKPSPFLQDSSTPTTLKNVAVFGVRASLTKTQGRVT